MRLKFYQLGCILNLSAAGAQCTMLICAFLVASVLSSRATAEVAAQLRVVPVLMYHDIVDNESQLSDVEPDHSDIQQPLATSDVLLKSFAEQMKYISENFITITSEDLFRARTQGALLPLKSVILTFDDGYIGNYKRALPILKQYGLKAEFYVHTDYVGSIASNREHMSWDQLRSLNGFKDDKGKNLFRVYSHTLSHPHLQMLSDSQLWSELCLSKRKLEEELGLEVPFLAYPFGDYTFRTGKFDPRVIDQAERCGYKMAYTIAPTPNTPAIVIEGQFTIPRVGVTSSIKNLQMFKKLLGVNQ